MSHEYSPADRFRRVHKTDAELAVLRYACKATCEAHKELMRQALPDYYEYQLERWGHFRQ